jgi:hypothetical protein
MTVPGKKLSDRSAGADRFVAGKLRGCRVSRKQMEGRRVFSGESALFHSILLVNPFKDNL